MMFANFKVKGKKPYLYNSPHKKGIIHGNTRNNPSEWKDTFWSEREKLFIPASSLFPAFINGGEYVEDNISKKLAEYLIVVSERNYIKNRQLPKNLDDLPINSSDDLYIDCQKVSSRGPKIRYRLAMSPGWQTDCQIQWDDRVLSQDQVQLVIEKSGSLVGIGDGRALGYGRFEVSDFSVD